MKVLPKIGYYKPIVISLSLSFWLLSCGDEGGGSFVESVVGNQPFEEENDGLSSGSASDSEGILGEIDSSDAESILNGEGLEGEGVEGEGTENGELAELSSDSDLLESLSGDDSLQSALGTGDNSSDSSLGSHLSDEDVDVLITCNGAWDDTPFEEEDLLTAEKVSLKLEKANNQNAYIDDHIGSGPGLKLIRIDVENANSASIQLTDPHGWYCIYITGKTLNKFSVQADCDSQIIAFDAEYQVANNINIQDVSCSN